MKKIIHTRRAFVIAIVYFMSIATEIHCRIPDDVVVVDVRPVLLRGHQGKLRCEFYGQPYAVYWLKGDTHTDAITQVDWYRNVLSGEKYSAGLMTMDANYSLIINTVGDDDAGRYYCQVSDYRGVLIRNFTDVSVRAPPPPDFLTVEGCSSSECSRSYNPQGTKLACRASNVQEDLINIHWLHNGDKVSPITFHSVSNGDGTQNIAANVTTTPDMTGQFACVAEIKSTYFEVNRISVIIPSPTTIPITTPSPTTMMTTSAVMTSTKSPANDKRGIIIAITLGVFAVLAVCGIAYLLFTKKKRKQEVYLSKYPETISYIELWVLPENKELAGALRQFLIDEKELSDGCQLPIPPKDIYNGLCRWKEKTEKRRQWSQLSKNGISKKEMKEFREKQCELSQNDISHISWCVAKQPHRVKKLLKQLDIKTEENSKPGNIKEMAEKCSAELQKWTDRYSRINVKKEKTLSELHEGGMKLKWRKKKEYTEVQQEALGNDSEVQEKAVKEGQFLNIKVTLCLALENAGCMEVAKTFFQISEKNKSPLNKEDIKAIALAITKRHCQSLGEEANIKPEDIKARNNENLEWLFRTDKLLEDWVSRQECSNYEIRCRLRKAAHKYMCIEKDQCIIYDEKDPSVSIHNEQEKPSGKEGDAGDSTADGRNVKYDSLKETQPKENDAKCSITDKKNDSNEPQEDTTSEKTPLMSQNQDQKMKKIEEIPASNECEEKKNENRDSMEGKNDEAKCSITAEKNDSNERKEDTTSEKNNAKCSNTDEKNDSNEPQEDMTSEKAPLVPHNQGQKMKKIEEKSASKECEEKKNESRDSMEGENDDAKCSNTDEKNDSNKPQEDTTAEKTLKSKKKTGHNENSGSQTRIDVNTAIGKGEDSSAPLAPNIGGYKEEQSDTKSVSRELKEQEDAEVDSGEGEEDVGLVSSITIEEIRLIRKYADPEVVRSIAEHLNLANPGSVNDMDIVRALGDEKNKKGQRGKIRKVLKKTNAKYEELLAEKGDNVTFKAEIPRLAMRLLMADVYPFAQALGYSIHGLSQFQVDHYLAAERKGTNEITRLLYKEKSGVSQPRAQLSKLLRVYGYRHIARAYFFDFDVSTSDLMAVAIRIEPDQLAKMLGIHDHAGSQTRTGNKIEDNMKMLVEWRKMMCPPDCNHRTALADIIHDAGFKSVAIGILTGYYRDCVPSREVLTELARQIPASEADRLREVLGVKAMQPGEHSDSDVCMELLVRWVERGKEESRNLRELVTEKSKGDFRKRMQGKLSDKLYDAGFIDLANEIMTGVRHGKVTQLTNT